MSTVEEPAADEAELLRRARSGDDGALETLYTTHVDTARALARHLAGPDAAEDLVADAFTRVLAQIKAGRGPTTNFRAYLCTTIRNRHTDIAPVLTHEQPASDRPWLLDGTETPLEDALEAFDDDEAVAALSQLPHTWRQVLWHLEIEGRRVPEVAHLLHTTPAAISSLAYRAREGLKTAYLHQHLTHTSTSHSSHGSDGSGTAAGSCGWVREHLAPFVRGSLATRATSKINTHLTDCGPCSGLLPGLQRVNGRIAALVVPILLVGATKGVKIGIVLGGATTTGGIASLLHGPRPKPTTAATVGVGAVAAAAVVAVAAIGPPDGPTPDDTAPPVTSSPAGGGGAPANPDTADPPPAKAPATAPVAAPPAGAASPPTEDEAAPAEPPAPPDGADDPAPAPPKDADDPAPPPDEAPPPTEAPPPQEPQPAPDNAGPGKAPVDNRGQKVAGEKAAPSALDKKPKGKPDKPGPPDHAKGGRKK